MIADMHLIGLYLTTANNLIPYWHFKFKRFSEERITIYCYESAYKGVWSRQEIGRDIASYEFFNKSCRILISKNAYEKWLRHSKCQKAIQGTQPIAPKTIKPTGIRR